MPLALTLLVAPPTYFGELVGGWAYVTMGATSIITEEIAPILGGFAAHEGHLGIRRVVTSIVIGSWLGGLALYFLGRWRGQWVMHRWKTVGRYVRRALSAVRRRPWRSSLLVRFAFGARIVLPLACGAARVPVPVYMIGSAISSIVWTVVFTAVGWEFGEAAMLVLGHVRRYEDKIAATIVGVLVLAALLGWRRRRARERLRPPGQTGEYEAIAGPPPRQ